MSSDADISIAIVDDDETFCRSLGRLLRASGMQPIVYVSAKAFLADTKQPPVACVVVDAQLEGMPGLDLRRELASRHVPTLIVFLSGHHGLDERGEPPAARLSVLVDTIRRLTAWSGSRSGSLPAAAATLLANGDEA